MFDLRVTVQELKEKVAWLESEVASLGSSCGSEAPEGEVAEAEPEPEEHEPEPAEIPRELEVHSIRCRLLEIVDGADRSRVQVHALDDAPEAIFRDPNGRPAMRLRVGSDGEATVHLASGSESEGITIRTSPNGNASLELLGPPLAGELRQKVRLEVRKGSYSIVEVSEQADEGWQGTAVLGLNLRTEAFLIMGHDPKLQSVWISAGPTGPGEEGEPGERTEDESGDGAEEASEDATTDRAADLAPEGKRDEPRYQAFVRVTARDRDGHAQLVSRDSDAAIELGSHCGEPSPRFAARFARVEEEAAGEVEVAIRDGDLVERLRVDVGEAEEPASLRLFDTDGDERIVASAANFEVELPDVDRWQAEAGPDAATGEQP